ncbi:3-hydroxyanthranilate 3,4-dioxygenase [Pelobates cultripes]|uniref:3-hydroxyanthranilate 3,4-dioxygenase n=2 Tax=Pelobates cultripes TaxID=61616 RepID=A0AAD1RH92_PELCU|nr:3-hydroxyanthranilate 3,4-dioxygenase [Pelobates cultripes]
MTLTVNVDRWVEDNKAYFLPPVCNKLMHNGQLTVMFVGGPNHRKDYHIQEGEELFYQLQGDMCLKIIENGKHKDIHIKEGEMFLLPARIPHSPQRFENTVGLVIERRRLGTEKDGLRYYVGDKSTEVLYEKWFYCEDLGKQLAPIINEFFKSKQYQTGKPDPDKPLEEMPFPLNPVNVMKPFNFQKWLENHRIRINLQKELHLFDDHHDMKVTIYGSGESKPSITKTDVWIWQLEGTSGVMLDGETVRLNAGESLLIEEHSLYSWIRDQGCVALCIRQEPAESK